MRAITSQMACLWHHWKTAHLPSSIFFSPFFLFRSPDSVGFYHYYYLPILYYIKAPDFPVVTPIYPTQTSPYPSSSYTYLYTGSSFSCIHQEQRNHSAAYIYSDIRAPGNCQQAPATATTTACVRLLALSFVCFPESVDSTCLVSILYFSDIRKNPVCLFAVILECPPSLSFCSNDSRSRGLSWSGRHSGWYSPTAVPTTEELVWMILDPVCNCPYIFPLVRRAIRTDTDCVFVCL